MADKQYGVTKVSGFTASNYESLTSHFEYVMITTKVPIFTSVQWLSTVGFTTDTVGAAVCQANLDKLIQIVSLRGQPVIMGAVGGTVGLTPTCTVTMAIEHPNAWGSASTASSAPTFATLNALVGGPGWADVRFSEDLKARIIADGINYGFGANKTASPIPPFAGIDDSATLAVIITNTLSGTIVP